MENKVIRNMVKVSPLRLSGAASAATKSTTAIIIIIIMTGVTKRDFGQGSPR